MFYREQEETEKVERSLRFELSVAVRRILSELSDSYLARSCSLSTAAAKFKNEFAKAS
jgi:hypothetical protein